MERWLFVLVGAGCGRLAFDARDLAADGAVEDAGVDFGAAAACAIQRAPDPLTISGMTFQYTSFDNERAVIGSVTVSARARVTGEVVAEDVSDGAGAYTLQVATGGQPADVRLELSREGHYTTRVVPDRGLDADVMGMYSAVWTLGDGPLWGNAAMAAVYQAAGLAPAPPNSTVNVAVRDCAGNVVDGVEVTVDPAPALLAYLDVDGQPNAGLAATVGPFGHVLLFNAAPGPTRIVGAKAGRTFGELVIDVPAGAYNTATILRALD